VITAHDVVLRNGSRRAHVPRVQRRVRADPWSSADRDRQEREPGHGNDGALRELPDDVEATPVELEGDAERQLAEQTINVDLMVTGSRGYGPHRAVLLGSVSGRLVRDAACPVIVVPRGIETPLEAIFAPQADPQAV
jgi:nucleotide-binding universal stress UspA family protein